MTGRSAANLDGELGSAYSLRDRVQSVQHPYREHTAFFVRMVRMLVQDVLYELDAFVVEGDENGMRGHCSSLSRGVPEEQAHQKFRSDVDHSGVRKDAVG